MDSITLPRMSADAFIAWSMEQLRGRFELEAGRVIEMPAERVAHVRAKQWIFRVLVNAIDNAGVDCEAFADGIAVQIDASTVYEPDALVRCGPPLPGQAVKATDPIIVVEVVSPSTSARDVGPKRAGYFRIPTIRHYLIVDADSRTVTHHRRDEASAIRTEIIGDESLRLDPPGLMLDSLFPGVAP